MSQTVRFHVGRVHTAHPDGSIEITDDETVVGVQWAQGKEYHHVLVVTVAPTVPVDPPEPFTSDWRSDDP